MEYLPPSNRVQESDLDKLVQAEPAKWARNGSRSASTDRNAATSWSRPMSPVSCATSRSSTQPRINAVAGTPTASACARTRCISGRGNRIDVTC